MKKRILSKALVLTLALVLVLGTGMTTASAYTVMYLYAPTGSTVNVRSEPSMAGGGATVLAMEPIGTAVQVLEWMNNGWAVISWGSGVAYVKSEFLSDSRGGGGYTPSVESDKEKAMDNLLAETKTYSTVANPFTIYPNPQRSSGFVNFRLIPVQYGKEFYRVYPNNALTVLGQTRNWYQVRDENTGVIGYIVKSLVTVMN